MGNQNDTLTLISAADLSSSECLAVSLDTAGKAVLATDASAPLIGPLTDGGTASGDSVAVGISGVQWLKSGGTINEGDKLTATTGGKWIATTTDTDHYGAIALEAATTNDKFRALIDRGMVAG